MDSIKKWIGWIALIWLAGVVITGVFFPRFQKKPPTGPASSLQSQNHPEERVLSIDDNRDALIRRLQLIRSAQEELVLSTYYLGDDESGRDVMAALLDAADRGVHVRILTDGFCGFTELNHSDNFKALTSHENVEARIYNPVNLLFPWNVNYRMHDKYLIADRQAYILGGRNTRNVSLGDYPGKHDVDRDILVWNGGAGGSLDQVYSYFESVWAHPISKPVKDSRRSQETAVQFLKERWAGMPEKFPSAFETVDFRDITVPAESVRLLTNPIEPSTKVPVLWTALMDRIDPDQDVLIQTPYIICNRQMYRDLERIARGEGSVKIITNCPEYGANPCGCADFLNNRRRLRNTGAEIWEYAGGSSSHTKTVLVGEGTSIVGSFNFDMRSTYLDTEMMLVIESTELNSRLRAMDEEYLQYSRCRTQEGEFITGNLYQDPPRSLIKNLFYHVLRLAVLPVRHLL